MANNKKIVCKILEFILHKYPLVNALTLLLLFAERAATNTDTPIHPRIVYANLLGFLGCALFMSSHIKRKEAALVFCGQLIYFAYNFYNNNKLHYKEWLRQEMCSRQVGCIGVYLLFAHIIDHKKSNLLRRLGEILLGIFMFAYVYLLNDSREIRRAFLSHMVGDDWARYVVAMVIAACALCFLSGYFVRDMALCAAVTIATLTLVIDCDFTYWSLKGVQFWNQGRMVADNLCICTGLLYAFFHVDNRVKMD
ncbi:transmembrane protein 101 [Aplysia californica]|uniref:Transmembrane protein 101 n=1 Tax=Aplysia californica TaxID=6500 RepID=A0ABM0K460_APLCA|nr:transmembrane protein 101 [Aplysia californica]